MFTDDHSRYTEVYFMNSKSDAGVKFKEYVSKVEKQYPKSKVCRIRVDGRGEYASCEKFLEYFAEEGIIRKVSAPDSQQQNGISERCNRTALDPAQSILKYAGMLNPVWAEAEFTGVYIKNRLPC
jgi:histone deacetylase 1/2